MKPLIILQYENENAWVVTDLKESESIVEFTLTDPIIQSAADKTMEFIKQTYSGTAIQVHAPLKLIQQTCSDGNLIDEKDLSNGILTEVRYSKLDYAYPVPLKIYLKMKVL